MAGADGARLRPPPGDESLVSDTSEGATAADEVEVTTAALVVVEVVVATGTALAFDVGAGSKVLVGIKSVVAALFCSSLPIDLCDELQKESEGRSIHEQKRPTAFQLQAPATYMAISITVMCLRIERWLGLWFTDFNIGVRLSIMVVCKIRLADKDPSPCPSLHLLNNRRATSIIFSFNLSGFYHFFVGFWKSILLFIL